MSTPGPGRGDEQLLDAAAWRRGDLAEAARSRSAPCATRARVSPSSAAVCSTTVRALAASSASVGQEGEADRVAADVGQREARRLGRAGQEAVRDLHQDAGAVAGVRPRRPRRRGGPGARGRSGHGRRCRGRDGRGDRPPCRRHRRRARMPGRRGQWPSASFRMGEVERLPGRRWPEDGKNRIHDRSRRLGTCGSQRPCRGGRGHRPGLRVGIVTQRS